MQQDARARADETKPSSAVDRIANELRNTALQVQPGAYLGSEESLAKRFSVSGPTLRQATRLLEHEEVIKVKRGIYGGYYAHRPDVKTISRVAATYLRSNFHSIDEVAVLVRHLIPLMVDLILANHRSSEMEEFTRPPARLRSHKDFVDYHSRFTNKLWELTDNAPVQLVGAIFFQVGAGAPPVSRPDAEGNSKLTQMRTELAQALVAKDRERAVSLAIEQADLIQSGIKQMFEALK